MFQHTCQYELTQENTHLNQLHAYKFTRSVVHTVKQESFLFLFCILICQGSASWENRDVMEIAPFV